MTTAMDIKECIIVQNTDVMKLLRLIALTHILNSFGYF